MKIQEMLYIKKLHEDAKIPSYAHDKDSGMDLYAIEDNLIYPNECKAIKTGLSIELSEGVEAQIRPKSGIALNHSVTVLNTPGTVDESYRGEIIVLLINHGCDTYFIEKGKKIAQMVICPVIRVDIKELKDLSDTSRGFGGFGSTGLN